MLHCPCCLTPGKPLPGPVSCSPPCRRVFSAFMSEVTRILSAIEHGDPHAGAQLRSQSHFGRFHEYRRKMSCQPNWQPVIWESSSTDSGSFRAGPSTPGRAGGGTESGRRQRKADLDRRRSRREGRPLFLRDSCAETEPTDLGGSPNPADARPARFLPQCRRGPGLPLYRMRHGIRRKTGREERPRRPGSVP